MKKPYNILSKMVGRRAIIEFSGRRTYKMAKKKFPLEKLIDKSIKEYCSELDRKPSDYEQVRVKVVVTSSDSRDDCYSLFLKKIPRGTEVVLIKNETYCCTPGKIIENQISTYTLIGTALIPKRGVRKKEKSEPDSYRYDLCDNYSVYAEYMRCPSAFTGFGSGHWRD